MPQQDYQRIRNLFDEAMDRPEAERRAYVERAAAGDPEVVQAVWRLLDAQEPSQSYFEREPAGGQRIDRYIISRKLGSGAMGVVFQAVDPLIGRTIAVKVIDISGVTDPRAAKMMREALFREARTAGVLAHPNIVTIYDIGDENDVPFIAMEYVAGYSLQQLIESTRTVHRSLALPILQEAASALDYAHSHGVIHRDVKPANILLHKGSTVKITDFGIARIQSAQGRTSSGLLMGTPSYMAPEQFEGRVLDGRADQFSLAAVAFEMFTGSRPFLAENVPAIMQMVLNATRPSARAINPLLPRGIDAVLSRGLARESRERYSSCSQLVAEIGKAVAASAPPVPVKITPVAEHPPYRPQRAGAVKSPPLGLSSAAESPRYWLLGLGLVAAAVLCLLITIFRPLPKDAISQAVSRQPVAAAADAPKAGMAALSAPALRNTATPVIKDFVASPASVKPGESFQLIWETQGASRISILPDVGAVDEIGNRSLTVREDTTYTLTATNRTGKTAQATTAVAVQSSSTGARPPVAASAAQFYADAVAAWRVGQRATALQLFQNAAELGDRRAMTRLAEAYSRGDGIAPNREQAAFWYRKAADAGDTQAIDSLGRLYAAGPAKDEVQAVDWYRKAVDAQNPTAMYDLGTMYENGRGVPKDLKAAIELYRRAAVLGDARAKARYAKLQADHPRPGGR